MNVTTDILYPIDQFDFDDMVAHADCRGRIRLSNGATMILICWRPLRKPKHPGDKPSRRAEARVVGLHPRLLPISVKTRDVVGVLIPNDDNPEGTP